MRHGEFVYHPGMESGWRLGWAIVVAAGGVILACTGDDPMVFPERDDAGVVVILTPPEGGAPVDAQTCGTTCDLVRSQPAIEVAVDATHVYWTTESAVHRAPKNVASESVETLVSNLDHPKGLSLNAAHAFFLTGQPCAKVHRQSLAKGNGGVFSPTVSVTANVGDPLRSVFLDGTLYYSGRATASTCVPEAGTSLGGGIQAIRADLVHEGRVGGDVGACTVNNSFALAVGQGDAGITALWGHPTTGDLCWWIGGSLGFHNDSPMKDVSAVAVSRTRFFWATPEGVFVQEQANLEASATAIPGAPAGVTAVALDPSGQLFLATAAGAIWWSDGAGAQLFVETGCEPRSLAVDEDAIYVPCATAGTIKRLAKPGR